MVAVTSLTPTKGVVTQVGGPWRSEEDFTTDVYQKDDRGKTLEFQAWTPATREDATGLALVEELGGETQEGETTVSSSTVKEIFCVSHTASPEYLRKLQVITLVVIGLIGLLIVSCLLLCMFYKNERLLQKLPWRKRKRKRNSLDISLVVNRPTAYNLRSIPSIRVSPTADAAPGGAAGELGVPAVVVVKGASTRRARLGVGQKKGKHFPTPKNMLLDVSPPLPPGLSPTHIAASSVHIPHGFSPAHIQSSGDILQGADAATASRFPATPTNYHKARMGFNDTDMRRHHPGMMRSQSLFGCSPVADDLGGLQSDFIDDCSSVSGASWYSEDNVSLQGGAENSATSWDDDEEVVAESRRGARGEESRMSLKSKDEYSDKYGSSMSARSGTMITTEPSSTTNPHEVSYLSGKFW